MSALDDHTQASANDAAQPRLAPAPERAPSRMPSRVPALAVADAAPAELLDILTARRDPLSLSELRQATQTLRAQPRALAPLRVGVLRTYTTEMLHPYWHYEALLQGFDLHLYEAPYGALMQEAEPDSGLVASHADVVFLFLRWQDLDPRLSLPVSGLAHDECEALIQSAAEMVEGLLRTLRRVMSATLVVSLLPRQWGPELGIFDPMAAQGDSLVRHHIKRAIVRDIETIPSALLSDLDEIAAELGRQHLFDARLWETARFPYSVAGAQAVVRHLMSYAVAQLLPKAKVVVLDADNTLWGGIVGEDGPTGIALGPDYPGSLYVAFQRRLLDLQQRGLLLALCSKNNPEDVAEVLAHHPHQVLREEHFAAMAVNWNPKPDNLRLLAQELNLGLDAFVFVDDSAHECLAVRRALPQVMVIQAPTSPLDLPRCLDGVARLQVTSLTSEDRARTQLYTQERKRQQQARSYQSLDAYLASLDMVMRLGIDDERHVARIAQLTQKTNQFNLTTRRYTEAQILAFMRDPDWLVADFALSDIFGDAGLVGVALIRGVATKTAEVDAFLMSCRVIGRRAEQAFAHALLSRLAQAGVERVVAYYLPTAKNEMVRQFWLSVGFERAGGPADGPAPDVHLPGEAARYERDVSGYQPSADSPPLRVVPSDV